MAEDAQLGGMEGGQAGIHPPEEPRLSEAEALRPPDPRPGHLGATVQPVARLAVISQEIEFPFPLKTFSNEPLQKPAPF